MNKKTLGRFKDQLGFARSRGTPFYPCGGKIGTGAWYKGVWDCSSCVFIHRGGIVSRIFELIYADKKISKIKKTIRKEFCR
ncbi:MAG: hypothetical protein ABSG94_11230 [Brevinematales bacterium]